MSSPDQPQKLASLRFDYIEYNPKSKALQAGFKEVCQNLEAAVVALGPGRYQSLALTALEEFYAWIGKAIRDKQREEGSAPPQEQRSNS